MTLLRPLLLVALIGGAAFFGTQWRASPGAAAPTAAARYTVEPATEPVPAVAADAEEYGRGPGVPAEALRGFAVPEGYELPTEPELLPGSPREYRGGFHEGIDFPLAFGMPVVAAKGGRIARIDSDYVEWSVDEQLKAEDEAFHLGYTPDRTLDRLRGRQVWIDHGHGVVTRYAHLQSVELYTVGSIVAQGTLIGRVGNSGTKAGPHLHIEIRVGDSYLGEGLGEAELLVALRRAFSD